MVSADSRSVLSRVDLATPALPEFRVSDLTADTGDVRIWVSDHFTKIFGTLTEPASEARSIVVHKVENDLVSGQAIFDALTTLVGAGYETLQLGQLRQLIVSGQLDRAKWYLCLVSDSAGQIWAVGCYWLSDCREWCLNAYSLVSQWYAGCLVLSG